jgi:NADPH:quinone reductase-like Zn-dependent oxidoreductase
MKAISYRKYGTPDCLHLEEISKPVPKASEVLIQIMASSVNSWDYDLLKGKPFLVRLIGGLFKPRHKILGADIAGIVEVVGEKVTQFKPGDEVFGDIAGAGFGGFAEYVAVPENLLARKSSAMTFEQSAALPQAGLLALQGLRYNGNSMKGQTVLINGAGGGVGTIALQFAKSMGAEVTCVDKIDKFDMLRALGADHLIDYKKEDYTRNGIQYDRILDVIAHRTVADYKRALKPEGTFVMIGGSMGGLLLHLMLLGPLISRFTNKTIALMGYKPNRKDLDYLSQLFEEGKVLPVIGATYSLAEVPLALHYHAEGMVKGKIVITVSQKQTN